MRIGLSIFFSIFLLFSQQAVYANEDGNIVLEPLDVHIEKNLKDELDELNSPVERTFIENLPQQSAVHLAGSSECYLIEQIEVHHLDLFASQSLQHAVNKWKKQLEGHCHSTVLLEQDINILNAMLYDAGYITSEVGDVNLYEADNLLDITLKAGRIDDITIQNTHEKSHLTSLAMPVKSGDILNINDIEQGVSNLRSQPNSDVKITLKPAKDDLYTTVEINKIGERTFSGSLSIDNKEKKIYGDLFGQARFNFGNLLQLNETLSLILSHDLDNAKSYGAKKHIFFLQLPYQYWQFSLFAYHIEYKNKISDMISGRQKTQQQLLSFEAQRQFRPSQQRTVSLTGGLQYYTYRNNILGQKISVHERRSPYITLDIKQNYRFLRGGNTNIKLGYKQSAPLKGAKLSPIESVNGVPIFNIDFDALIPFNVASQHLFYQPDLSIQLTKSSIDGLLDKSTIGGSGSVYGFALGSGYSDENQFLLRQKISWLTPIKEQLLFTALDYGSVAKDRGKVFHNKAKYLVGFATGLEGSVKQLNYQFTWGIPLQTPEEKQPRSSQLTFSGQFNF